MAANKRKAGGIGAIDPIREIQALKARWIVRMLRNKGDSWADLMWMEFQRIAKRKNVKKPLKSESWPKNLDVHSIMKDAIRCWNKCNIQIEFSNGEPKWIGSDGKQQPLASLTVKMLYNKLNKTPDTIGKNKFWFQVSDKGWMERWVYLATAKHLGPKDRQMRFKIQQAKLWCGSNRQSKEFPNPKCPICKTLEQEVDHAVTTNCKFTKQFVQVVW